MILRLRLVVERLTDAPARGLARDRSGGIRRARLRPVTCRCIASRLFRVRAESPTGDEVPDGTSAAPIERRARRSYRLSSSLTNSAGWPIRATLESEDARIESAGDGELATTEDPVAGVVDARFPTDRSPEIVRPRSSTRLRTAVQFVILAIVGGGLFLNPPNLAPPQPLVPGHRQRNREVRVQGGRPGGHHRGALPRGAPGRAGGIVSGVLRRPCPGARGAVCVPPPGGVRGLCFPRQAERAGRRETERGDLRPPEERDGGVPRRAPTACGRCAPLPAAKTNGHGLRDDLQWDCFEVVTAKMDAADGASGVLTYSNGDYASPGPDGPVPPVRVDARPSPCTPEKPRGAGTSRSRGDAADGDHLGQPGLGV